MDPNIEKHIENFEAYAAARMAEENGDKSPMSLKIRHTRHVLENAVHIVAAENPPAALARATLLAALYHDVARFEQYLRFRSFKDAQTVNHGLLGIKIAKKEKMLAGEDRKVAGIALAAIGLHNRYALPKNLPEEISFAANVVRDSDKLDILRVMDEHLSAPGPYNPTVVLSLPDDPDLHSKETIAATLAGRVASYSDLKSVNDFRLLLGSWLYEMHFPASRRRFVCDGHARNLLLALPAKHYEKARDKLLRDLDARK